MSDQILLTIFGTLSAIGLLVGALALYFALQNAKKNDGEIRMALWSVVALAGLTLAGMCWAYFIIPILSNRYF